MTKKANPRDYGRISIITFNSLKEGKLTKEDIVHMIQHFKKERDYAYCDALILAFRRWDGESSMAKEIWKHLGKHIN